MKQYLEQYQEEHPDFTITSDNYLDVFASLPLELREEMYNSMYGTPYKTEKITSETQDYIKFYLSDAIEKEKWYFPGLIINQHDNITPEEEEEMGGKIGLTTKMKVRFTKVPEEYKHAYYKDYEKLLSKNFLFPDREEVINEINLKESNYFNVNYNSDLFSTILLSKEKLSIKTDQPDKYLKLTISDVDNPDEIMNSLPQKSEDLDSLMAGTAGSIFSPERIKYVYANFSDNPVTGDDVVPIPNTGMNVSIIVYIIAAISILGGIILFAKTKKQN